MCFGGGGLNTYQSKLNVVHFLALKVTCFHSCVKHEGKKNFRGNKSSYFNVNADVFVCSVFILKKCCHMNTVLRSAMMLNNGI